MFQYFFEFKLNGKVVHRAENENPQTFNDVEVWASNGDYPYAPADAYIEDLRYGDPAGTNTPCSSEQCHNPDPAMGHRCSACGSLVHAVCYSQLMSANTDPWIVGYAR